MANVAASLAHLLTLGADINYYTQQQIFWANKYEANAEKLSKLTSKEEKWNDAYDDYRYGTDEDIAKYNEKIDETACIEESAVIYADYKVGEMDWELLEELTDLDMEYDTMKTMYETALEMLRAQKDSQKQNVSNGASDTGLISQ